MKLTGFVILMIVWLMVGLSFNYFVLGSFTWNMDKAFESYSQEKFKDLDCEFGAVKYGSGITSKVQCTRAPCKTYNIEGYECIREGHTGTGFLGFSDLDTTYYVCKDLGRVALACKEYFKSQQEFDKFISSQQNGGEQDE